jgi:biopolymer transport protein TolR
MRWVPQPAIGRSNDPVDIIVVQVLSDGELRINQELVAWDRLADQMESIYKERAQKVAFIRGEAPVEFALVARAIDVLHGSGISVGLLTPGLEQ